MCDREGCWLSDDECTADLHEEAMNDMTHLENEMIMRRPWTVAEGESVWSISGLYPKAAGAFEDCLAVALPGSMTDGHVLFKMIGGLDDIVSPDWITSAQPLLLVHRDDPATAYFPEDQEYLK